VDDGAIDGRLVLVETAIRQESLSHYRSSEKELGKREAIHLCVQAHGGLQRRMAAGAGAEGVTTNFPKISRF
jgi:hypothetical protein